MPVVPIRPKRLYREVADQITSLIAKEEFHPGQRLPAERELAVSLDVSRPTIREAMIALEIAGVINIRPGAGNFVAVGGPGESTRISEDIGPDRKSVGQGKSGDLGGRRSNQKKTYSANYLTGGDCVPDPHP